MELENLSCKMELKNGELIKEVTIDCQAANICDDLFDRKEMSWISITF